MRHIPNHMNLRTTTATGRYDVAPRENCRLSGRLHRVSSKQPFLNFLLVALIFTCAMRNWQYFIGVRIMIYDIFLLLISITFLASRITGRQVHELPTALKISVKWLWIIFFLGIMTFPVVWYISLPSPWGMYLKGTVSSLLYTAGLTIIIFYVNSQPEQLINKLLKIYILGATVSALFCILEIALALQGIDLGKIVFGTISTYRDPYALEKPFYYEWSLFFRAAGVAGVNAQGTYLASVIPLLLFTKPFRSTWKNQLTATICLLALALTMSRTALFSLVAGITIYAWFGLKHSIKPIWYLLLAALPLIVLFMTFKLETLSLLETRGLGQSFEITAANRTKIAVTTFNSLLSYPFGYGLNQYAAVVKQSDIIDFSEVDKLFPNRKLWQNRLDYENIHNSFLTILSEGGWLLLIANIAFYISIIRIYYRSRSEYRIGALCSIGALLTGGLTNNTLELFSSKLLIILLALLTITRKTSNQSGGPLSEGSSK